MKVTFVAPPGEQGRIVLELNIKEAKVLFDLAGCVSGVGHIRNISGDLYAAMKIGLQTAGVTFPSHNHFDTFTSDSRVSVRA